MASADFCCPIPTPRDVGSQLQDSRPPRVMRVTFTLMPAASTSAVSVYVLGFEDSCLLTHGDRLLCGFCSSGQRFACGFLQIPPRGGHPCRPANRSPYRADSGLSPPSHPATTTCTRTAPSRRYAPCLAHKIKRPMQCIGRSDVKQLHVYLNIKKTTN